MKYFWIILTFLLPTLGSTVLAQTGMAVFGNCSVSENTLIVVSDDQLMLKGAISGNGKVVMAGAETQTIACHNGVIDRLVISNLKSVKVKGKLTVRKSLSVEQGNLLVETQSELVVWPTAWVMLASGSQLIDTHATIWSKMDGLPHQNERPSMGDALVSTLVMLWRRATEKQSSTPTDLPWTYQCPDLRSLGVPPWVLRAVDV